MFARLWWPCKCRYSGFNELAPDQSLVMLPEAGRTTPIWVLQCFLLGPSADLHGKRNLVMWKLPDLARFLCFDVSRCGRIYARSLFFAARTAQQEAKLQCRANGCLYYCPAVTLRRIKTNPVFLLAWAFGAINSLLVTVGLYVPIAISGILAAPEIHGFRRWVSLPKT